VLRIITTRAQELLKHGQQPVERFAVDGDVLERRLSEEEDKVNELSDPGFSPGRYHQHKMGHNTRKID
jgi:hypothetical protein